MKALSLTQPWATLSAYRLKKIETRSWPTKFRGTFALHAAKGFPKWAKELWLYDPFFNKALKTAGIAKISELPLGAIIGIADLTMCLNVNGAYLDFESVDGEVVRNINYCKPDENTPEFHFGDYSEGRFMFFMENAYMLPEPIPCKGALSFWEVPGDKRDLPAHAL
jgi:hypothetical protein